MVSLEGNMNTLTLAHSTKWRQLVRLEVDLLCFLCEDPQHLLDVLEVGYENLRLEAVPAQSLDHGGQLGEGLLAALRRVRGGKVLALLLVSLQLVHPQPLLAGLERLLTDGGWYPGETSQQSLH